MVIQEYLWKRTLQCEEEPVLSLTLRRPDLVEEGRAARRIQRYYSRIEALWRARWEGTLYRQACQALAAARASSRPFQPWEASLTYTVTLEEGDLLSLYLEAEERGPSRRGAVLRFADTWDRRTGTPQPLSVFLPRSCRGRKRLLAQLRTQAEARLQTGESLLFQDAPDRVVQHFSPARFYLSGNSVALFYPMLSIGSAAEGIPVFFLERDQIPENKDQKNP